ncbi:MAG: type II toxin-antitoxin system Phd/YefM family antitoxin [Acidobacteriota bacterium]
MLDISKDIRSLSDFKRNTSALIRRAKKTGRPVVLTVNGKAEIVMQDASAYQKLLQLADRMEAIQAIRKGMEDARAGRVRDAGEALEELRAELGLSR